MTIRDEEDRREYYRIEDRMALQIRPLAADATGNDEVLQDESPLFDLLSELHLADFEAQHLLRQLGDQERTLGAFLRAQNRRLDVLSALLAHNLLGAVGPVHRVVLSEGGLEVVQDQAIAPGTAVLLKMVLLPRGHGLLLQGRITHCEARSDGHYELGAEFTDLSDAQRQLLARHILQHQQLQRRQQRDRQSPQA